MERSTTEVLQSPVDVSTLSPFLRNRVFILYESLSPSTRPSALRLKANRPGGEEVCEWVGIMPLERRDDMIHKFAARALLGDLEQGQSHIHVGPNALPRNTTQAAAVRLEGERIGCKWALVSPWTSFYAVEEQPGESEENGNLLVGDGELPSVELVDQDDPGLLRPRGLQTHFGEHLLTDAAPLGESNDESDEDSDEEADDVESEGSDTGHDHETDDSDRHDGQGGGRHAGGRGTDHDASSDRGDRDDAGGDDSEDDQPPPDCPANTTGNGSYVAAGQSAAPPIGLGSTARHAAIALGYQNATSQGLPQQSWTQHFKDGKQDSAARESNEVKEFLSVSELNAGEHGRAALFNWLSTAKTYVSDKKLGRANVASPDNHSSTPESHIVAPAFNPLASTSLLETPQTRPATREDEAKEAVIRNLLVLQATNGSFGTHEEKLAQLFGPMFLQGVDHLKMDVWYHIVPEHTDKEEFLSLTFAIIALLTTRFQSCEPLWRLIVAKAKGYTSSHVRAAAYPTLEQKAEALFATMDLPRYQLRRLDLRSIAAQSSMNIRLGVPEENQANNPPEALKDSSKGSPTDPKLTGDSRPSVSPENGTSSLSLPYTQEPLVRRRISLEFAPYEIY